MVSSARGSAAYGRTTLHSTSRATLTCITEAERVLRTVFRRCLLCPVDSPPCPSCTGSQICSLVPSDCNTCAHAICVDNPNASNSQSSGPNVGAIAGGVVGGVVLIALIVFLVWFLWIRKRRAQQEAEAEEWEEDEIAHQKAAFQSMVHDAASTRTRGSVAHSFLSRASNVIQIAFIPGVTTRNGSSRNSMLVPPIPAAARSAPRSPLANQDDAIFFGLGDIQDNTSSMVFDNRRDTQYSTSSRATSFAASSIYHDSVTMQPAPLALAQGRGVPRMISVKSKADTSYSQNDSIQNSPAGSSDYSPDSPETKPMRIMMPGQGSNPAAAGSLRTHGSLGKAHQIMLGGKAKGRFPVRTAIDAIGAAEGNSRHYPAVSSPLRDPNNESDDDEENSRGQRSLLRITPAPLQIGPSAPYSDTPDAVAPLSTANRPNPYASMASTVGSSNVPKRGKSMGGLSAVIEEATRKASNPPAHAGLGGKRERSPFDDANRIDEESS